MRSWMRVKADPAMGDRVVSSPVVSTQVGSTQVGCTQVVSDHVVSNHVVSDQQDDLQQGDASSSIDGAGDALKETIHPGQILANLISRLGDHEFESGVLRDLYPLIPAASWSVYRTGQRCQPTLFLSASLGIPDTTQECWWAYLSGPYLHDRTWVRPGDATPAHAGTRVCHITAQEVGGEHQSRVYEAYGVVERMSIVEQEHDGTLFAVNVYRHQHQRAFSPSQRGAFEAVAPALLALTRKHLALTGNASASIPRARERYSDRMHAAGPLPYPPAALRGRLLQVHAGLTARELDVCVRLLQGLTHEGIACDLGLSVPTIKTYRNRAFARLGIHFRNELFAVTLKAGSPQ